MRYLPLLALLVAVPLLADDFDERMKRYAEDSYRDRQILNLDLEQQRQQGERAQDQRRLKCELERLRAASRGEREPFCLAD